MKNFEEFKEAIKEEQIKKEWTSILEEKKPESKDEYIRICIEFAEEKGYTVTAEELSIEEVSKRKMSEAELEKVAAGLVWCWSDHYCALLNN